jgi:hypothetical protein
LKQKMKFFVVRVNLKRLEASGAAFLRPIVLSYTSERFMLPMRLGTLNSPGEQDLSIFLLSPRGRIETKNYRTVKVPSNINVPELVKPQFESVYRHTFKQAYAREGKNVAFLEHAWNTGWCDPCSSDPPSEAVLRDAGVFWQGPTFLTRLHVRYTAKTFPEDLIFQETDNQESFQSRYIIQQPFKGPMNCDAAKGYRTELAKRQDKEAQNLAWLTGWDLNHIRQRIRQ